MNIARAVASVLGAEAVDAADDELDRHAHDLTPAALLARRRGRRPARPACVAFPGSAEDVGALLAWANEARVAVVPYGGGSGVCGAIAPRDAVVVDLGRMCRVLDVDERSRLVRVEAGITGGTLASALRARGHTLGHEPQSVDISTVGGWIATRACGQLSARYGGVERLVTGLVAVLPDGTVAAGKVTPRRSAGPDVAALMFGSEGTLGIVTEATLRISPAPAERADACIAFDHMADGVAACRAVAQSDLAPTVVRLYDREDAFIAFRSFDPSPEGPLLLLSFDGGRAAGRASAAAALCGGRRQPDALVEHWWRHRNDAVAELPRVMAGEGVLGPHAVVDTIEVSGTWSVLRGLYHALKEALTPRADIAGCHLSHVYPDGACLYFTMASACADDDAAEARLGDWWAAAMRACLDAGGSISHHHGIGRQKAPYLAEELGPWHGVLVAVKRALDPNGIMNPGALGL